MIVYNVENPLKQTVENIESFYFFKDGAKKIVTKTNKEFEIIKEKIKNIFEISREMPAFGVSLDLETLNALKKDEWMQINFSTLMNQNSLPFNALLFKLESTSGFNLIRMYNGKYEGRCIFLDFNEILDLKQILNISWQNILIDLKLITVKKISRQLNKNYEDVFSSLKFS